MKKIYLIVFLMLNLFVVQSQEKFPGGVEGANVWVILENPANPEVPIEEGFLFNEVDNQVKYLRDCGSSYEGSYFNYNHSIYTESLCFSYLYPLENLNSSSIFFVGNKKSPSESFSHLTTDWSRAVVSILNFVATDSVFYNRFDFASNTTYAAKRQDGYGNDKDHNINHLFWNQFNKEKKFKSYGFYGEAIYGVGTEVNNSESQHYSYFGNFPEFISFPFKLNKNQIDRVDSYLALKYGLTLNSNIAYKNSQNLEFWYKENNNIFQNNIFGIGRDDISGLKQQQSTSMHFEEYLAFAFKEFEESNLKNIDRQELPKDHFVVVGDNAMNHGVGDVNAQGVRMMKKKWLAQVTGGHIAELPLHFRLDASYDLIPELGEDEVFWMLHDENVNNQNASDFDNEYVHYYNPTDVEDVFINFKDIRLDKDGNNFDQFTFGVGPEIIIQAQLTRKNCREKEYRVDIVITGGRAPYRFEIVNTTTGEAIGDEINTNTYEFYTEANAEFEMYLQDATGTNVQYDFDVTFYPIHVDFGEDIELTVSNPTTILDAGEDVEDPEATYEWYQDGESLSHYGETLEVDTPGIYEVVVTSGDRSCEFSDEVEVYSTFSTEIETHTECDVNTGQIDIDLFGGFPPYTIMIQNLDTGSNPIPIIIPELTEETQVISNLDFGNYELVFTDSNTTQSDPLQVVNIEIEDPMFGLETNLAEQLMSLGCSSLIIEPGGCQSYPLLISDCDSFNEINLEALTDIGIVNATYEWYANEELVSTDPVFDIYNLEDVNFSCVNYKLIVTSLDNGCVAEEKFSYKSTNYYGNLMEAENPSNSNENEGQVTTTIYPNPANHSENFYYQVDSDQAVDMEVRLYDINGNILEQQYQYNSNHFSGEYCIYQTGVYFIHTITNEGTFVDKIIIN